MSETRSDTGSILVLGAGELGTAVLRFLSVHRGSADRPALSVLLRPRRPGLSDDAPDSRAEMFDTFGVTTIRGDLATETDAGLAAIFAAFSTVVCCTGFVAGPGTQRRITAAVLAAGVGRYVPWQFGVDYDAVGRGSGQDVWDEQLDVREMLRAQSRTRWTIVSTGIFTSFLFEPSFGVVDLVGHRVHALGSWDNRITVTTSDDIGKLTAEILLAEPEIDGIVFVAGDTLSYAELADAVDEALGVKVERVLDSVSELQADLGAAPEDDMRKYRLAFARETGVAWNKATTFNVSHGISVTDVPAWLTARLRSDAST